MGMLPKVKIIRRKFALRNFYSGLILIFSIKLWFHLIHFSDGPFRSETESVFILGAPLRITMKQDGAVKGAPRGQVDLGSNPGSAIYQLFDC